MGRTRDHLGLDSGRERHAVFAHFQRHHDFFERGVAGALPDAVDGALDLTRAGEHAGQRIRDRETEIVVTMRGEDDLFRAWNS